MAPRLATGALLDYIPFSLPVLTARTSHILTRTAMQLMDIALPVLVPFLVLHQALADPRLAQWSTLPEEESKNSADVVIDAMLPPPFRLMYVCMYVCLCMYMYVSMYACMYICICVCNVCM